MKLLNHIKSIKWTDNVFLLLHPASLSLYLFLILVFIIPDFFAKYTAEIIETEQRGDFDKTFYYDLNGDGISERIATGYNYPEEKKEIRVQHFNLENKIYDQWMPRGKWLRLFKPYFGDYNNNGFAEIYCLTIDNDSLFLSIKELMLDNGKEVNGRFICKAGTFKNGKNDIVDWGGRLIDINKDGFFEYIFFIYGGFSKFPRNTFSYNIVNDSLRISPKSASGFKSGFYYMDINGDDIDEITGSVGSPENINYEMPYTDSATWLMVIDPVAMDFCFPPIKFDMGIASSIRPVFYKEKDNKYIAVSLYSNSAKTNINEIHLILFDKNGKLLNKKSIERKKFRNIEFINPQISRTDKLYLIDNSGNIYQTDTSLNITLFYSPDLDINGLVSNNIRLMDIDNDGQNEMLMIGHNKNAEVFLLAYRQSLKDVLSLKLPKTIYSNDEHFELIYDKIKSQPVLMLQAGNNIYKIKYRKNHYYTLKYPAYAGVYALLFLVFWLLQRIQTKIAQRKFETERQLISQQMAISKRQLEPHFMLNALNNIGYMFMHENQKDAQYYFGKFSSLIHRGLKYADKIETSLAEELNFIRDYLILQKKRLDNELVFIIEADEDIELDKIKIPHSLLFTFVENAVKHGLRPKPNNRKLEIFVKRNESKITISISDNGIGRQHSRQLKTTGTGKGLSIISTIVESYNKLYKRSISYNVMDLIDKNRNISGTQVIIEL